MTIVDYFEGVKDPRVIGRCKHKLSDILVVALASYLCGAEDYESMHELCLERGESLRPLVELPNGTPSTDTFERVLQRIEPHSLYACLSVYGKDLIQDLEGKHIAIDGKRLRGAKKKNGHTHILSAWVDEVGLSLAQETVVEKHNELQAIPEVLDSLDLSGSVVSIDAMGTQKTIAEQIIHSDADYVLSLKANQKHLFEDVRDAFTGKYQCHTWETLEKDHGRIEKRIYTTLKASEVFNEGEYSDWQGLQTLVQVERIVSRLEGETRQEKQYYISSLAPELCQELGQYIRGHWCIENRLHWHLDVSFREDACGARKDYSATNLNTLRKFALAIVSQYKDKLSLRKRLFKAALNINYLKRLLKI
ncbi:ISAs1 family transposase [Porphyromonas circumdentaria]|uniref:Transposase, IS4 family n=1 Tax=Porphyromonas circumdentaria TaxID=29524 RepID=A0A1T4Q9B1_9PORP|nr:ISAs1 family transposase [Porphyromonas circumdentaria]MBB6276633.1 putative transposase YbfD/YdcC [Porphyromonas circumdentaria]SKA00111.1 transposase, IS4 family [Porphyromonas circumdentaria]